jgi:hypothetical protein
MPDRHAGLGRRDARPPNKRHRNDKTFEPWFFEATGSMAKASAGTRSPSNVSDETAHRGNGLRKRLRSASSKPQKKSAPSMKRRRSKMW